MVDTAKGDESSSSMMAWRVHEFGPPEVLKFERLPQPRPGQGEVLIKVAAAGVGPWDAWIRAGKSALPQPLPLTPGADLSGHVAAVGPGESRWKVGDEVYGVTNPRFVGAYAEYAVANSPMISKKPGSLTFVEAASVPVVAVTAWQALFDHAKLRAGQTVLIHGAAGNVGAYAVQFAHRVGVRTIATAAASDTSLLHDLGADVVIDFRAQPFEHAASGVDAVIDLVGGDTQTRSFAVLREGGRLISAVSPPDPQLARKCGVEAEFFLVNVTDRNLAQITTLLDEGSLQTRVGTVLPLSEARAAHLMLDGNQPRKNGKIVLAVESQ